MSVGFVIGNGKSRLKYDLSSLQELGIVFGCNGLYRDFSPDILVSVDSNMIDEVLANYKGKVLYVGRGSTMIFSNEGHPVNKLHMKGGVVNGRGWASGSTATWLLCKLFPQVSIINLIGFDLYGIGGKINNVYAGTEHYQPVVNRETPWQNWTKQLREVFDEYKDKTFYRVGDEMALLPEQWYGADNLWYTDNIMVKRHSD